MKKSLTAIILVACIGCNYNELDFSDLQTPTLNSNVAIPIGTLDYTMREMIEKIGDTELQLEEDSTSLIKLTYFDSASFDAGEELISIESINNSRVVSIPELTADTVGFEEVIEETFEFTYPPTNDESLDSVFYKNGTLRLNIRSNLAQAIDYQFTIHQTINTTTRQPIVFSGNLGGNESDEQSQSLANHRTELVQLNELSNVFQVGSRISFVLEPGETTVGNGGIEISLSYLDQEFSILYGNFGNDTLKVGNEVLNIKFFEELGESGLKFGAPEITFNFSNSFGLPLGILFDGMYVVDSTHTGSDTTYLAGDAATIPQVIHGAEVVGESVSSVLKLNNSNSSIRNLLSSSPRTVGFSLTAIANPEGSGASSNFVLDSSKISTTIEMALPMELSLDNLERAFDFGLGKGLKFDESDSVTLRVVSENELPFSARVEIEMLDENDSILYAVPGSLILEIPFLDLNGLVSQPRKHTADLAIGKGGIDALANGDKIRIRLFLNTPSGSRDVYVKILADYGLKLKVAAVGRLKVDL